ncbi:MAG: phytanoyl-CoA dioxygenase family protein [Pseudomonadota bacterium]
MRIGRLYIANRADARTVFGLIAVRTIVAGAVPSAARVRVTVGDVCLELPIADCLQPLDDGDRWQLTCHVNSHLLANGPQSVTVTLLGPDGAAGDAATLACVVDNGSVLAHAVAADLRAFGTPVVFGDVVDSRLFPHGPGKARAWFEEPVTGEVPLSLDPARDRDAAMLHLRRWGFAVLPQRLPRSLVDDFGRQLDTAIDSGRLKYERGSSNRIYEAHTLPAGRRIWLYPPVLKFLEALFRDRPCPCQTLTYAYGSQQQAHQDTIHLTPYPGGYMCGVWVALQDVQPDSGELFVCPGSHRLPRVFGADLGLAKVMGRVDYAAFGTFEQRIRDLVREHGLSTVTYRPRAGEILVWHENLIHGGSPRLDLARPRLSIVSHYFARGCVAYYDSRGEAATLVDVGNETVWGRAKRLVRAAVG